MASFRTRIKELSSQKGKIVLANDYDINQRNLVSKTISNINTLHEHLCGIKLNFHLLLPLGSKDISKITKTAHSKKLLTIADIKLNDIGNTNRITIETLWKLGFDAVIVNPIMGLTSLKDIILHSHLKNKGVITLCHMSAPSARMTYDMNITFQKKSKKLYELFLEWALKEKADGIIAGATYPEIIKQCSKKSRNRLDIYSPGVGIQGGDAKKVLSAGSNFLIVGRSILESKNPKEVAKSLHLQTLTK
jgi:orotidine-5'-phosphate decarboxylase